MVRNISWGWRKLLSIRYIIRPFFWHKIGDGTKASAWFDQWADIGPLISHITYRAIHTGGFSIQDKVVDIVHDNAWRWPNTWLVRFPTLSTVQVPILHNNQEDELYLKSYDGLFKDFTVRDIWHAIRDRESEVAWHSFVWSTYGIPRHSIHVWLIMRKRLKTQDRLRQWDVGSDVDLKLLRCPLCRLQPDTHEHLFFECYFAANVWKGVLQAAELPDVPPVWSDIMDWIIPMAKKNNVTSIVGRLIVAATTYYVWQERNQRLHGKKARKAEEVMNIIVDMVRSKLASIRFKKKARVENVKIIWKLPLHE